MSVRAMSEVPYRYGTLISLPLSTDANCPLFRSHVKGLLRGLLRLKCTRWSLWSRTLRNVSYCMAWCKETCSAQVFVLLLQVEGSACTWTWLKSREVCWCLWRWTAYWANFHGCRNLLFVTLFLIINKYKVQATYYSEYYIWDNCTDERKKVLG